MFAVFPYRPTNLPLWLVIILLVVSCVSADEKITSQRAANPTADTLHAFQPKDPNVVKTATRAIYAVFAIGMLGFAALFIGWAKYYSPRYWQQSYRQTELKRSAAATRTTESKPSNDDRDRFDLEGDIVDLMREIDRHKLGK